MNIRDWFIAISVWLFGMASAIAAQPCMPFKVAPDKFPNAPLAWAKNTGPILSGFVDLRRQDGGVYEIEHGVDLSRYNTGVEYPELKRCGATFAMVQMDSRFHEHQLQLEAQGIEVIPYHYLSVVSGLVDYKSQKTRFDDTADAIANSKRLDELFEIGRKMGRQKAERFVHEYKENNVGEHQGFDLAGIHGQLVAVDVEEHLAGVPSRQQYKNFGRFYAAMLSSWIEETQKSLPDVRVIFYTFPDIYTSYLQLALPKDNAAIHGIPIWLAKTSPADGGDFNLKSNKDLQRICLSSSGGNRCILHQYSHRGVFAIANSSLRTPPPSIDLDRLFPIKEVQDNEGVQYVRRDN